MGEGIETGRSAYAELSIEEILLAIQDQAVDILRCEPRGAQERPAHAPEPGHGAP